MIQVINYLQFLGLCLSVLLIFVLLLFYAERKMAAFFQDRSGPLHHGKSGTLQPFADLMKLLRKETIIPDGSRSFYFVLAPFLVFAPVLTGFSLLPLWPGLFSEAGRGAGLLILPALISLEAPGILMASWASSSRFPSLGAGRAIAQMVAYEVPLALVLLCIIWVCGTADFRELETAQTFSGQGGLFPGLRSMGGFFTWNLVQHPYLLVLLPIFFLSILAESNRAPFDIPEGESEIIGGFHTEYSGFLWAVFFLAEYAMMLLLSMVMAFLFFGGSASPIPGGSILSENSFFWLAAKSLVSGLLMIWVRWSLPRLRADQLSTIAWRILSPAAFFMLLVLVLFF
jgi:NADH-quinone oxidoreductase subunit H